MLGEEELAVSYSLTDDEARRASAEITKRRGVTKFSLRVSLVVSGGWIAMGLVEVLGNYRPGMGWFNLLLGCLNALNAYVQNSKVVRIPAGVATAMRLGEDGIVLELPAVRALPWSAVESVERYAGSFVITLCSAAIEPPLPKRIAIPKRALGDGGNALWRLCEQTMIGPLRRVSAQLSLDVHGSLRRNDAQSIVNVSGSRDPRRPRATPGTLPARSA